MSTHSICFHWEIRKYLPDTHSYRDLWAMSWTPPSAGFEPGTLWSKVGSPNHSTASTFIWKLSEVWTLLSALPDHSEHLKSGVILEGDLGEKVSISWLTSLYWAVGEVKMYRMYKEIQNLDQNFSLKSWNCCKTSPYLKALGWPL